MLPLWPLIILLPPLAVTLGRGRTAWAWLSLAIATAALTALVQFVLVQWANGNTEFLQGHLTLTTAVDGAYHDTYYVIANLNVLAATLIPALILGLLLLLPSHPRRDPVDLALFWSIIGLTLVSSYGTSLMLGNSAMPRRYVDYGDALQSVLTLKHILDLVCYVLVFIAAARPVLSWWRARKAS